MRPGMGAGLSGVPPLLPADPYGQRHESAATNLHAGRRPLAELRETVGRDTRADAGVVSRDVERPSVRSHAEPGNERNLKKLPEMFLTA
jgi:hypothetical protein